MMTRHRDRAGLGAAGIAFARFAEHPMIVGAQMTELRPAATAHMGEVVDRHKFSWQAAPQ